MLQSLVRMCNITMLWHMGLKEFFHFLNFPNAQPGGLVDLLLKKNRHDQDLRVKIAVPIIIGIRFIIAKILKRTVSLPSKGKNVEECDARKAK